MERELIEWLKGRVKQDPRVVVGIGDDAASLACGSQHVVVTSDMLLDGVHFHLAEDGPRRVGRKIIGANLSDLAAMAAKPLAAFVSLAAAHDQLETIQEMYEGMLELAEPLDVALAGGDTNVWDGPLVVSVTLLGEPHPKGLWLRSGAQAGDRLLVTGTCGGSLLGRHLDVQPRIKQARYLRANYDVHAAVDISDGLALDAARIASASGCGLVLDLEAIPISEAATEMSRRDDKSPLEHALGDGEDFELLLAVAETEATRMLADEQLDVPLSVVGTFIEARGLWRYSETGRREPLAPDGYWHGG